VLGNNHALVLFLVLIGTLFWPTDKNKEQDARSDLDAPDPIPAAALLTPQGNVASFAEHRDQRNGSRPWAAAIAIGLGISLAIGSIFLVVPFEAKRAVMATLGW
jgi:hypothetical protein